MKRIFTFLKRLKFKDDIKSIKRRYRLLKISFVTLLLLLVFVVYINFDYLVFKFLISDHYIYTDALDHIYEESINVEPNGSYFTDFDDVVIKVFTDKIRSVNSDRYTYLYLPEEYKIKDKVTKIEADKAEIRELTDSIVYIYVPNISKYTKEFLLSNKKTLNEYSDIVIDLRSNSGGSLNDLYKMSELFLDKDMIIGKEIARNTFFSKTIKASKKKYFDFENIIFLQDEKTASASEGFIMSLKENMDNVFVIGSSDKSYGKGIGQLTLPLKSGYAVKATVIRIETPKGNSIHGEGISSDYIYEDEDIIEYAKELIVGGNLSK